MHNAVKTLLKEHKQITQLKFWLLEKEENAT